MQLSVIILNYNVRYFLEQCVCSVQKALEGIDGEIIVVDNASSDDSVAMMQSRFPQIKLIANTENLGFPKGNNIGVAAAKGTYLCILNPDTVVAEDTLKNILDFARCQPDLGIVGCKLIDGTGRFLPESKRGIPTPWVSFTKIFGLYKIFPKNSCFNRYYAQQLGPEEVGKTEILVGAFMVLRRDFYLALGGFDEDCFMYSDDIDLSYRALLQGKSNYYYPGTSVIHYKGESTVKDGVYMERFRQAMNYFYKKHFSPSLFFSVFMRMGAAAFSLSKKWQGKPKKATSPGQYILVSGDVALAERIQAQLGQPLQLAQLINGRLNVSLKPYAEIIIDSNQVSYKEAIRFMEFHQNKTLTFKFIPQGGRFLIGSNSSTDRGEVIRLEA